MSIARLNPDDFETFTLETNPKRTYTSSSLYGVTGAVNLYAIRSDSFKDVHPSSYFSASFFNDHNIDGLRKDVQDASLAGTNIFNSLTTYIDGVTAQQSSLRQQQLLKIYRFVPLFEFNTNTGRKLTVINSLMPHYRSIHPMANFSYVNYHCLNFYTASNVPSDSVLLYPNPPRPDDSSITDYGVSGSFSFDFWIKPKYTVDEVDGAYRPGCLLHLTNSYAITLHSGSSKDHNGRPDAFKLLLQVSGGTNVAPDAVTALTDYTFFSNDNALPLNKWSHVTIRWGGSNYNYGSGSFIINDVNKGNFVITSAMALGLTAGGLVSDPSVLCIGNYFQGTNNITNNSMHWFFNGGTAIREGLYDFTGVYESYYEPASYLFNHPLNAEIHELKIYDRYLNINEISALSTKGAKLESNLRFYLPPFFTEESPTRTFHNGEGGLPATQFFAKDGTTIHPFAKELSFGCGGHFINLENYVRDFVTGRYPRLLNLTSSFYNQETTTIISANSTLYSTGSNIKRQYTILPNDNGSFYPNFDLLRSLNRSSFTDDLGTYIPGLISLRNMLTGSEFDCVTSEDSALTTGLYGGNTPDTLDAGGPPGSALAIYNRTRDTSSNQVVLFDISNMFYGNRIKPLSFVLTDIDMSGSDGKIKLTIRDDGNGNLYRADADGAHPTWASIGNIFYDEGVILLKMPQLYFFGSKQYECTFEGMQNIHVLSINAYARPMQLITSSYMNYQTGSIEDLANVDDPNYVFISEVLLHDDNLNVIGRTKIAQPVLKRSAEKFKFVIKMDF
jgi:hypothetical protein